jgi:hypothetical protein
LAHPWRAERKPWKSNEACRSFMSCISVQLSICRPKIWEKCPNWVLDYQPSQPAGVHLGFH